MSKMNNNLNDITFITITFNDPNIDDTFLSYSKFFVNGASLIVVNGGEKLKLKETINYPKTIVIEESDNGRYDALNKGISMVKTTYFMLIHAGDQLLLNESQIETILNDMYLDDLDLVLGNQFISFHNKMRRHTITLWSPLMNYIGAQPPHMPIIYRTNFTKKLLYNQDSNIIADHIYLSELFKKKPKWRKSKLFHIRMQGGGVTSSGLRSFFTVSNEFRKEYGVIRGIFMTIFRIPLKFLQMV